MYPTNQELDIDPGSPPGLKTIDGNNSPGLKTNGNNSPGLKTNGNNSPGPSNLSYLNSTDPTFNSYNSTEQPDTSLNNKNRPQFDLPLLHLPLVPPDPNFSLGPFNDDEFSNNAIEEDDDGFQVSPYALSYGVQGRYARNSVWGLEVYVGVVYVLFLNLFRFQL